LTCHVTDIHDGVKRIRRSDALPAAKRTFRSPKYLDVAPELQGFQVLKGGPESFAVRFLDPVLSELICRRAQGADDDAFALLTLHTRTNL
jgi:hypothetical protein